MPGTYQYEPGNIAEYGKDRMRFELGDVMVEGKEKTCALCDEEYNAVIPETVTTDGDTCGFDIEVIDLDSAEHIYLNYYFQFSTIVAASGE